MQLWETCYSCFYSIPFPFSLFSPPSPSSQQKTTSANCVQIIIVLEASLVSPARPNGPAAEFRGRHFVPKISGRRKGCNNGQFGAWLPILFSLPLLFGPRQKVTTVAIRRGQQTGAKLGLQTISALCLFLPMVHLCACGRAILLAHLSLLLPRRR